MIAKPPSKKPPQAKRKGATSPPPSGAPAGLDLAALQAAFQHAMLTGDDAILDLIPDGARESRSVLLGVYRNGYASRLIEIVGNDFEMLHTYVGDETFYELARDYVLANPSQTRNARYYSTQLPQFLSQTEPYRSYPQVVDLAVIERALTDAFDAPDASALTLSGLTAFPLDEWPGLTFKPHPSAQKLTLSTNAFAIWLALKETTTPPEPETPAEPVHVLVWRQDVPKARIMGPEETMMWVEAAKGVRFGILCELVATYDDPETAPARAASYLAGWIGGGLLAGAQPG